MKNEYATYEIGEQKEKIRYFLTPQKEKPESDVERKAHECIKKKLLHILVEDGINQDPYKVAEKILADHYGYAKMIEAHYTWRAGVRY